VIDAALSGTPARQAAARFGIGIATAIRWVRQARASGDRKPARQGRPRRGKLDIHRAYILGLVAGAPDMTISEMQERLIGERGVQAGRATLWKFLDRAGLTFKKSPRMRPNRIVPMSARVAANGSRTSSISIRRS
jgi:transposase